MAKTTTKTTTTVDERLEGSVTHEDLMSAAPRRAEQVPQTLKVINKALISYDEAAKLIEDESEARAEEDAKLDAKIDNEIERANQAEDTLRTDLTSETARAKDAEKELEQSITDEETARKEEDRKLQDAVDLLNDSDTTEGSVKHTVTTAIAKVIDNAPESFDTLKEIADWISSDETKTAEIVAAVEENSGKIEHEESEREKKDAELVEQIEALVKRLDKEGVQTIAQSLTIGGVSWCPLPIDYVYWQLPGLKDPNTLFPGTSWEKITTFNGAFFRAEGEGAGDFDAAAMQGQSIQSHAHKMDHGHKFDHTHTRGTMNITGDFSTLDAVAVEEPTGAFYLKQIKGTADCAPSQNENDYLVGFEASRTWTGNTSSPNKTTTDNFTGNTEATGSSETRPKNYTIRLWKRVE